MRHSPLFLTLYLCAIPTLPASAQNFAAPAPPKVEALATVPPPAPTTQPGLKLYHAPKPLAKNAITTDWRQFLGVTFNAISPETPLLTDVSKGKPTLLWEVTKGKATQPPPLLGSAWFSFTV